MISNSGQSQSQFETYPTVESALMTLLLQSIQTGIYYRLQFMVSFHSKDVTHFFQHQNDPKMDLQKWSCKRPIEFKKLLFLRSKKPSQY